MNLILLLIFSIPCLLFSQNEISIAAIFQNEARFLDEWINYHHNLGVQHFRLYNNNSEDNYLEVLKPWIDRGVVNLIQWPHEPEGNDWKNFSFTVQIGAYNDALKTLKGKTKWLALIDTDEFISVRCDKKLKDILNSYPKKSSFYLNWCMYGTNGVWDCEGNLIEKITMHALKSSDKHLYCKSIVQPKYVEKCVNPHYCVPTKHLINTDGERVDPVDVKKVCWNILRLNHYWTRDRRFMEEIKISRRVRWGNDIQIIYDDESKMNCESD